MGRRSILLALSFMTATAVAGQNADLPAHASGPRPITRTEGRQILASLFKVDSGADPESDCSHLVHDVYRQAGYPYEYVSSRDLYVGSASFTRVRAPQAGDLVVWQGHVGIVIDPKEHSFFSSVRSGPDTQFYDSRYWRSRGVARFYRYVLDPLVRAGRTLEASAGGSSRERTKPTSSGSRRDPLPAAYTSGAAATEPVRLVAMKVAAKTPAPDEVAAAFAEMTRDFGRSLRARSLSRLDKPVVVYRELRVSSLQVKGKRGTALVEIETLGVAPPNTGTDSLPRWNEQWVAFEKAKRGWVMVPIADVAYVPRDVALQSLSARLAELAQAADATPDEEREQKQIVRFLSLLVPPENANAVSAQSH